MMDEQLKATIIKKIELAQDELKAKAQASLEGRGRKTSLSGGAKRPKNALLQRVKRKLLKERLWGAAQDALTEMGFDFILRALLRKQGLDDAKAAISAAKAKQLELFPGYEHLPVRIKTGSNFLKFHELPVGQFLKYEARYQMRAQTNQQTAEELRRLRIAVKPFAEIDPEMPMARAFDRATTEPAKLTVVAPKGA